jgi:hypothetical protein
LPVVVLIVFIADVEWRVGKYQISKWLANPSQNSYTIAADNFIKQSFHVIILAHLVGIASRT